MRVLGSFVLALGLIAGSVSPSVSAKPRQPPLVIIVMENRSYAGLEAFPATDRTYLDAFAAGGVRFSNYTEGTAIGPSLPDYLSLAAGSGCGTTSDRVLAGEFGSAQGCPTTVWNQLQSAHLSWDVYADAMPAPCAPDVTYNSTALDTPYVLRHNPATPFASIWSDRALCRAHVLPFTSFPWKGQLPAVSFVAPGICNDQHGSNATVTVGGVTQPMFQNCTPNSDTLMRRGDAWLATYVPPMLAKGAEVVITYDESGILYAAVQGPGIAVGSVDATPYTHYGLLRSIEDRYNLGCLNNACTAAPLPL